MRVMHDISKKNMKMEQCVFIFPYQSKLHIMNCIITIDLTEYTVATKPTTDAIRKQEPISAAFHSII